MLHISQIAHERVERVGDYLKEGQIVKVKVMETDEKGRIKLSMKVLAGRPADLSDHPHRLTVATVVIAVIAVIAVIVPSVVSVPSVAVIVMAVAIALSAMTAASAMTTAKRQRDDQPQQS